MDAAEELGTEVLEDAELVDAHRRDEGIAPLHDELVAERRLSRSPMWLGSFLLHGFDDDDAGGEPPPSPWVTEDARGAVWLHQSDDHDELHSEELGVPLLGALRWLTAYGLRASDYSELQNSRWNPRRVVSQGIAKDLLVNPRERETVWLDGRDGRALETTCERSTHVQMSSEFGVMTPLHIGELQRERREVWVAPVTSAVIGVAVLLVAMRALAMGWVGVIVLLASALCFAGAVFFGFFAWTRAKALDVELARAPRYETAPSNGGPYRGDSNTE